MSPNPWAEAPAHVGTPDEREARVPRRSHGRSTAPLSAAQRVLRRLHRLDLHGGMASRPVGLRLHGPLDVMALGRAIEEVVRRHEALRTVFRDDADGPVQVVQPVGPVPLAGVDLRAHPPAEREAEAMRVAAAESRRPFDLAVGPMVRALLIRIDAQDHALVLSMHHMSADAWSAVILLHELAALYGAFASGASSPLAELPIQYADYAAWE
ncbi:MAG TPA: condensation domain-containing protein, partial [Gemmatimonadales bacterium]|nr:condensation domain-containing protein [Gemmatimonadales bacterium]